MLAVWRARREAIRSEQAAVCGTTPARWPPMSILRKIHGASEDSLCNAVTLGS